MFVLRHHSRPLDRRDAIGGVPDTGAGGLFVPWRELRAVFTSVGARNLGKSRFHRACGTQWQRARRMADTWQRVRRAFIRLSIIHYLRALMFGNAPNRFGERVKYPHRVMFYLKPTVLTTHELVSD